MSYVNDETIHILSKIFTQMDGLDKAGSKYGDTSEQYSDAIHDCMGIVALAFIDYCAKTETEAEYQKIKEEQDGKDNN